MKNKLFILLGCMISVMPAFADDGAVDETCRAEPCPPTPCATECCLDCPPIDGKFWDSFGYGWRQDQIKFGGSKWQTQNMGAVTADLRLVLEKQLVFEINGEYARSFLTPREGEVYDFYISSGYLFERKLQCVPVSFGPIIGYSTHHQFIKGGHHFHRLHASYNLNWNGPFIGFASFYSVNSKIQAYFDYQFHWQRFRSNVIERGSRGFHSEFNTTTNKAFGNQVALQANYNLFANWYVGLQFEFKGFWATNSRRDHRHEDDRLHHFNANWNSYSIVSQLSFEL